MPVLPNNNPPLISQGMPVPIEKPAEEQLYELEVPTKMKFTKSQLLAEKASLEKRIVDIDNLLKGIKGNESK